MMKLSQETFCSAPWFQIRNDNDGSFRACCLIDHKKTQFQGRTDYYLSQDTLSDWLESDYLQYLRKELTDGNAIPECDKCWQKERNGLRSLRHIINRSVTESASVDQSWVHFYLKNKTDYSGALLVSADVKLSNLCNFSCAMCNPLDSTKIYTIWSKNQTHPMVQYSMRSQPDILKRARDIFVDNKNIGFLKTVLDHDIRHLKILGGEPLLDAEMLEILENLDDKKAKKITLSFVTNGSVDLVSLRNRLHGFKNVIFIISLEGISELQDYVRKGSDWKFIESNIKRFIDQFGSKDLYINHALQALTILGLPDLIRWCETHRISLNFGIVNNPDYLSLKSVPEDIKQKAIDQLNRCECKMVLPPMQNDPHITFSGLIDFIKESTHDPMLTSALKQFVDWYDPSLRWKKILPEWNSYL
jgi:hypothetical protein